MIATTRHQMPTAWAGQAILIASLIISPSFLPAVPLELNDIPDAGVDELVDVSAFGSFQNVGTSDYHFEIANRAGLSRAVGSGIYPNEDGVLRDSLYQRLQRTGRLDGALDKFSPDTNPTLSFYKWASQKGTPNQGLRFFNIARSLERAGQLRRAFNAYYAVVLYFPKEIVWQDAHPWYVGVAALDEAYRLLDQHPEWKHHLEDAEIQIENGFDRKGTNDVFHINPGRLVDGAPVNPAPDRSLGDVVDTRGSGQVHLVKREPGGWQLLVDDHPYFIRGVCYSPTPVGRSPDFGGYKPNTDWMKADENHNGRVDAAYDTWVDANFNNHQDADEPAVGDFRLLQEMGANTIRLYHHSENKELLRDLANTYGIRVLLGDLVGGYAVGSGATWEDGTDYSRPEQREAMRDSVRKMVVDNKDEPYVLLWVLGNENNYGHGNNADKNPVAYYRFLNSLARMIHILDKNHPVAICNGDLENLDLIARETPDVDVLAVNAYRGEFGMGRSFWRALDTVWKKPVFISEFGAPAINSLEGLEQSEERQANYLAANWNDIERHSAGGDIGNSLGGAVFEWLDEWWKAGPQTEPSVHDRIAQGKGPFFGGQMFEEWLGLVSQGDGDGSPYLRRLRPAYTRFKEVLWSSAGVAHTHDASVGKDSVMRNRDE